MSDDSKESTHEGSQNVLRQESADVNKESPTQVSPGELLREARTDKNMSVEELTGHTMLSRATVQALEENNFGHMSQPVFVRGYYRKCAKVLDISEDEIMQAYAAWTGVQEPKPVPPSHVNVVPEDVTPDSRRGLALLILVVVVGAIAAWLLLPGLNNNATNEGETTTLASDATDSGIGNDSNGNSSQDTQIDSNESTASVYGESAESSTDTRVTAPSNTFDQSAEPAVDETPTSVLTSSDDTQAAAPTADTAALPDGVYLKFNERSWVDIRNGNGKRVLGGIVQADTEHTYPGDEGPYDVRLGYAPGIDLFVNRQPFDLDEKTGSDNTARFVLEIP